MTILDNDRDRLAQSLRSEAWGVFTHASPDSNNDELAIHAVVDMVIRRLIADEYVRLADADLEAAGKEVDAWGDAAIDPDTYYGTQVAAELIIVAAFGEGKR